MSHVLGCHIEMTSDPWSRTTNPDACTSPDEPPLEMTVDQLREIRRAIGEIGDQPGRYVYPEFVIYHQGP